MMFLILFLWTIPYRETTPVEESLVFEIVHNEKVVGELKAIKRRTGGFTEYENRTTVEISLLKKFRIEYLTKVVFDNGVLSWSAVETKVNGEPYADARTVRTGTGYEFFNDGKLKKTITGPITYSSVMMLFGEPAGINSAYSEEGGGFHPLESLGQATYRKRNARGRASVYQYQNRVLQNVAIDAGLVEFEMARQD